MPNPYDKYGQGQSPEDLFGPREPYQPRQRRVPTRRPRPEPEPEPVEVKPEEEELGWFRTYGPHVARGIGGLLGVGWAPGAMAGGGAEIIAQGIEQGDWTPEIDTKRVAAEAAIGGMGGGFAKMLGLGATSVGRALGLGAAMGGAAPVLRHGIEEGEWDPREYAGEVGTGAAIGGAVGGGFAKLMGMASKGRPAGPASRYEVESTAVPGGQTLGTGKQKTQFVNPIRPIQAEGPAQIGVAPGSTIRTAEEVANDLSRVPYMGGDVALLPSQERAIATEAREAQRMADRAAKEAREAERLALEKRKFDELQGLLAGRGDVEAKLSESVSATDPVTGHRLSANFREVAEEEGEDLGQLLRENHPYYVDKGGPDAAAPAVKAPVPDVPPPAGGTLQDELARVQAELDAARAAEAPIVTTPDKPMTFEEILASAADEEPPVMGSPVAPSDPPPMPGSPAAVPPVEPPVSAPIEEPAASPLGELLGAKQPGKGRAKKPRKSKSERFEERAAKIAGEAPPLGPDAPILAPIDDVVAPMADVRNIPPQEPPLATLVPTPEPPPVIPGTGGVALAEPGADVPQDLMQILRTRVGATGKNYRLAKEAAKKGEIPNANFAREAHLAEQAAARGQKPAPQPINPPVNPPEVPPSVATPTNWIDDEAAALAKLEALPPEQRLAAFLGQQTDEAATIPANLSMPDPSVDRNSLAVLEREFETLARAMEQPGPVNLGGIEYSQSEIKHMFDRTNNMLSGVRARMSPEEPAWVAEEMASLNRLDELKAAKQAATPAPEATVEPPKPPITTVAELLGTNKPPVVPPTAAQMDELQRLRQQSGAIESTSQVPEWLQGQIQAAPEAPPSAVEDLQAQIAEIQKQLAKAKGKGKGKGKGKAPEVPAEPPPPTILTKPGAEGAPRLNKAAKEGKYGGHDGPPNPQDYRPKTNPERGAYPAALATHLGMGLAGAAVGGATDPLDDPFLSALAGGAAGLSIPTMAKGLMSLGASSSVVQNAMQDLNLPDGIKRATAKIGRVLPQMQRANYLADVVGLPANAWAGPYGSGVFGALEKGLSGDSRGWAVLNELKNPWNFFKEYPSALQEARELVGRSEGFSEAEAVGAFEKGLTWPGTLLTGGDVAIRRILMRHGFSDDEARIMTMTAEPFTKSGQSAVHLRGPVWDITFPFKRTPTNIVEQGFLRTPGLGFKMQQIGADAGTRAADPLKVQIAQQALGAGIGVGSEQLSENLTPEQARVTRRLLTNLAGPYSLLAGAGFATGQARRRGQPALNTRTIQSIAQQLPMPSIEPLEDNAIAAAKVINQGPSSIRVPQDIPRGTLPTQLFPSNLARDYKALASFFEGDKPLPPRRRRRS